MPGSAATDAARRETMAPIIAVIVSYYPVPERLALSLAAIASQVDAVVVVDNGSPAKVLADIPEDSAHWVRLPENLGLARAQNIGIDWARGQGAQAVVLLDQDSRPLPGMVSALRAAALACEGRLALAAPHYVDERQDEHLPFFRIRDGRAEWIGCPDDGAVLAIDTAISSGALIPLAALDALGGMHEALFIDLVDIEWCLRARARGFVCLGVCGARLAHALGEEPVRVLGRRFSRHSPLRNYYFYRNAVWLFGRDYVPWAWKRILAKQLLLRWLFFPLVVPPRFSYLRLMTLGVWHGLRGRLGRLV